MIESNVWNYHLAQELKTVTDEAQRIVMSMKVLRRAPPNNHSTSYTPEQVVRIMSLWDTILVNKSFTDDLKRNLRIIKLTFPLIPPKGCHCIVERFMQNIRDPSQWTTIAHYYFLWGHTRVSLGILAKAFWRRTNKTPKTNTILSKKLLCINLHKSEDNVESFYLATFYFSAILSWRDTMYLKKTSIVGIDSALEAFRHDLKSVGCTT